MGADGYIEIAQIADGLDLLNMDEHPVFKVTEPVCVLPAFPRSFGDWTNFDLYQRELQNYLEFTGECWMRVLLDDHKPAFGICVVAQKVVKQCFTKLWQSWEHDRNVPGAVSWKEVYRAWNKITPGCWAVTEYYDVGGFDVTWRFVLPVGCQSAEPVKWRFWT